MRVHIGPYKSDLIPVYSWIRRYEFMRYEQTGNYFFDEEDYRWYDKLVFGFFDKLSFLVSPINRWANNRTRKLKVHIDNYDVWNADHTLAQIIHPVLVKCKEQKQGAPNVDDEDVPEHLRSTSAPPKENEWDTDDLYFDRWSYVLDEMIWAFEQCIYEDNNEDQFYHNPEQLDMMSRVDNKVVFNYQKDPSKPKYWVDEEGLKSHYDRIKNGHRLFGKYYFALWI